MASKKTTLESLANLISESSASADKKFAALAEDIADIKSTMVTKDDLAEAVEKLDDRLTAVESKIGGIHNRIDDEALKCRDLETRVRSVVPNLPPHPERV
jgi:chromosome segregation ATPase